MRVSEIVKLPQIRKTMRFVGSEIFWISILSVICGVLTFIMESSFAFVLQLFFAALGLIQYETLRLPIPISVENITLGFVLVLVIGIVFLRALLQWVQSMLQYAACFRFVVKQRSRMLDWSFGHVSPNPGEVVSYFGDKIYNGGIALLQMQGFFAAASSAFCLMIALFYFLPLSTAMAFGLLALIILPIKGLSKKIKAQGIGVNEVVHNINTRLFMDIKNLLFLRLYGIDQVEKTELKEELKSTLQKYMTFYKNSGLSAILPQVVGTLIIALIVWLLRSKEEASATLLMTYFYLFIRFLQTASNGVSLLSTFSFYYPSLYETAKWWAQHAHDGIYNPVVDDDASRRDERTLSGGSIGFKIADLSFRYASSMKLIFDKLSFGVKPGQCLVIVGPSGAGKSTLLGLLLGQLKPQSGEINIIDNAGAEHELGSVRRGLQERIGYVGPDPFLITGSIRENLTYGLNRTIDEKELWSVLEKVEGQFVTEFDKKLEHHITFQGEGLSAGQKQRISLARALLRRPSLLVLDEATANLDSKTEKELIKTLDGLKGQTTLLVVTHREALLSLADQVLNL